MKALIIFLLLPTIILAVNIGDFFRLFPPRFPQPVPGPQFQYGAVGQEGGLPEVPCWEYGIEGCIFYIFMMILSILYPIALFAAVIMFVLAGVWYITGWKKAEEVHTVIKWGVIGLIVAILSFSIVQGLEQFILAPFFPYITL